MGSKGRMPPPYVRRQLPVPGMVHPDPYGPAMHPPPPGPFPAYEMLPPAEVMEQKLAGQHVEMQRLVTENQRLAATHGTLRQELAGAQHELQILQSHIGVMKSEREQHMRGLIDKISQMEAELKGAEPVRSELQQARQDAENLVVVRQELMGKVHQLNQEIHQTLTDVQQIPALMSELEGLRQEYQRCRISFDYEKKLFSDHLESLQVMEKNYITMSREVEKLRSELTKTANIDIRTGGAYGGATGNNDSSGHLVACNRYEDGYGASQTQENTTLPPNFGAGAGAANATAPANLGAGTGAAAAFVGSQPGSAPKLGYDVPRAPGYEARAPAYEVMKDGPGYDPQRGHSYDAQRGPGYDMQRGPSYDAQRGSSYDAQRSSGYDVQRGHGYDAQRGTSYDMQQRLPNYDPSRGASYDASSRGTAGPQGQVTPASNLPYGSATPPTHAGSGYEAPVRGGNPLRR